MTDGHTGRLEAALAGRYKIERKLGEGGMASVYLALDLKHDRNVALKILRPELAAVIGAERFLTEIKTTANLQHPHILPLFDSGSAEGFLYYVMPYIEGETLRDKLDREQQLGVDEAVRIAREVGDALDYAHRKDIIHRDIKPANILLNEGRPVVADFGIALAISAAGGGRMTETGLSLGTPHYMSPEQASADRDLTARSDVYSLGCVLYEMLAGQPPHTGPSAQSILMRILTEDPRPITDLRRSVPPNVAAAITKATEKLPADRFETAQDFVDALDDPTFAYTPAPRVAPTVQTRPLPGAARPAGGGLLRWAGWGAAAALALVAAWGWLRPSAATPVRRLEIVLDSVGSPFGPVLTLSPDGSRIAYVGPAQQLWVRDLRSLEAQPVPGAVEVFTPFFSPNGLRVGYRTGRRGEGKLMSVSLGGAPPVVLSDADPWPGGTWSDDGHVYFTSADGALQRVPDEGGVVETVADTTGVRFFTWPQALPGGGAILANIDEGPVAIDPDDGEVTRILEEFTDTQLPTMLRFAGGYLFWVNRAHILMAAPFDARGLTLTGPPVALASDLTDGGAGSALFAVSDDGSLLYSTSDDPQSGGGENMAWVDRAGAATVLDSRLAVDAGDFDDLSLGPDPRYIAAQVQTGEDGASDMEYQIWIYDLDQKTFVRLTLEGSRNMEPRWVDEGTVAYIGRRNDRWGIYAQPFDGSGAETTLFTTDGPILDFDVSPTDGSLAVTLVDGVEGSMDIVRVIPGSSSDPTPLVATRFMESGAALSPDGRWLAYTSDESGRREVYVRAFPSGNLRAAISTTGGGGPRWGKTGDELFYSGTDGYLKVAALDIGDRVAVRSRNQLFSNVPFETNPDFSTWDTDVTGEKLLLILEPGGASDAGRYVLLENVFRELKERGGR